VGTPITGGSRDRYPAMPTNLTAVRDGNFVRLQWSDNSHNESGFHIGTFGPSGMTSHFVGGGADARSFQFPELPDGWAGCFAVRAFTTSGSFYFASDWYPSGSSSNICASIPRKPPPVPTGVTVQGYAEAVQIQWSDNTTQGVPEFKVEVTGGMNRTLTTSATNYWLSVPASIETGVEYCVRVQAFVRPETSGGSDNLGESPWSSRVCATTRPYPAYPSNITVTVVSPDTLRLNWTDNSGIETFFRISRLPPGTRDVPANTTSYDWTGLTPGVEYCFQVSAYADDRRSAAGRVCETPA
jgi:hypothetical protein